MIRLASVDFDAVTGEVYRDGSMTRLEPQPAAVLALLASRAGDLVTHEEIRQAIWGDGTHVNFQQSLHYCIRRIRIALDDPSSGRIIETIPRRGYRLSRAAVVVAAASAPEVEGTPPRRLSRERKRLVLTAAAVTLAAAMAIAEQRPNRHHEMAVAFLRTIHALVY